MDNSYPEILFKGPVSNGEIIYLQKIYSFDHVVVNRFESKGAAIGGIEHSIQILFHDFKPQEFLLEYFLVELINRFRKRIFPLIQKAVLFFKRKSKVVDDIIIIVFIQCETRIVKLQFVLNTEDENLFLEKLQDMLNYDFLKSICSEEFIFFKMENDILKVSTLK